VSASTAAKIQNRTNFSAVDESGYQLYDVLCLCLVAMLVDS
jgi:hypothetical protein